MHQGRISQFGPTASIYRQPDDVTTAQVFSDPPINLAPVAKRGERIIFNDSVQWPATGATEALLELPEKPSIAVLPFDNMSSDPEQEFFVDGIVEDIITELSRFGELFVIARNSSFA